jgi:Xaa-Pro aminopeptidase
LNSHIEDGVALTKFLYWIKNCKINKITERYVENKLETFRKKSNNYLYPSFNTIAGSGPNGAIIHYRSTKKSNRKLNKKELLLLDSGGQYKWGTTDVTRTICFSNASAKTKDLFTRVLKGHIAVALSNINNQTTGEDIDKKARKSLNSIGLDYRHGTGHGVGFFLNVHEGPQSISRNNKVKLVEGMILSNEPGFYLENKFGIRIENLVFIKRNDKKLNFENLTFAPIDKDLINFKMLTKKENDYLFKYHLEVYSKISPFLNKNEKKWLAKLV